MFGNKFSTFSSTYRVTKILKLIYKRNACYKILEPDEEKQKEKINNHLKAFAAYPSL